MNEILEFALVIAREAGARLLASHGSITRDAVGYKGWRNLVTELDLEVERLLTERIGQRFPDHAILAEEGVDKAGSAGIRWIIDPLDGTTNYVHGHPMYCVSIGVYDASGPLAGVIYAPYLREQFHASRGGGAWFDGDRRMQVSHEGDLSRALLASGFTYRGGEALERNLVLWTNLARKSRGLRRCGSAALDLAYVAAGRYDGFWELKLSPWDVAAGALLVLESGGRVTDCAGGDDWLTGGTILATNGPLHPLLLRESTAI